MKIQPIDRERPEIAELRRQMQGLYEKAFEKDRVGATRWVAQGLKLKKAGDEDDSDARVDKLLAELELEGIAATREEAAALLAKAAQNGGYAAFVQLDYEAPEGITDLVNTQAVAWASDHAAELITQLQDDTKNYIRGDVVDALQPGSSVRDLSDALQNNYGFSQGRSERIARTELAKADCQGNMIAYRNSGLVKGKKWLLGSEHPCSDECDINAARGVIPLDQDFPSGDDAAPAHPNCVCDFIPADLEE